MYLSRRRTLQGHNVLKEILQEASDRNMRRAVTGLLISDEEYFLQILEGRLAVLSGLFEKIYKDHRHYDVRLVLFHAVDSRLFKKWSMGSLPAARSSAYPEGETYLKAIFQADMQEQPVIGREEIEQVFLWFAGQKDSTVKWANIL
ncbi:BLUF domain-containing protein [Chromatocurvus halotolerans]|nr:BLUF domain-containing protein [Chromatocurvus halotolerans]